MSTRSVIGVEQTDGGVLAVRCHFNGYPNMPWGVGYNLTRHYDTADAAGTLVAMGGMSMLGAEIGKRLGLERDGRPNHLGHDQCVFYHRDWRMDEPEIFQYETVADFCRAGRVDYKMAYLFRNNPAGDGRGEWVFSHCAWGRIMPAEPRVLTEWDLEPEPEDARKRLVPRACFRCGAEFTSEGHHLPMYDAWRFVCDLCFAGMYPKPGDLNEDGRHEDARWPAHSVLL